MQLQYESIFSDGKILDVGCFEAPLRKIVGPERYTGIDIAGEPDILINLEKANKLPFQDGEFNTVICIEVLEHLENIYELSEELFRLSSQFVLISLPNSWRDARSKIEKGYGSFAHYGLPRNRPKDRHKWFFNLEEAANYLKEITPEHWECQVIATEPLRPALTRRMRRLMNPGTRYANRYCQTAWALYQKSKP